MVTAAHIEALIEPLAADPSLEVSTLAVPLAPKAAAEPSTVKVVTRLDGRALYFSRSAIPFDRESSGISRLKHLGFYAYRRGALERFCALPPSPLENAEKLEQLRFLENGIAIHVSTAPSDTISVDTPEDLARVEEFFRKG